MRDSWPRHILLPSDERFEVAAKDFKIQGAWSAQRVALTVGGVWGQAEIYLNGVEELHKIGTVKGDGTAQSLVVEPARFNFDGDNVLFIRMGPSSWQNQQVFGAWRGGGGSITGPLKLEVQPEVSFSWETMSVAYLADLEKIVLEMDVECPDGEAQDLWRMTGEFMRGDTVAARGEAQVQADRGSRQRVIMEIQAPEIELWSLEDPVLYNLCVRVGHEQGSVDSLLMPLGFSQPGMTEEGCWTLNGDVVTVKGVSLSAEEAAVLRSANEVDAYLTDMKEQGINVIYFMDSVDEYWLSAADRVGIGAWCELPVGLTASKDLPEEGDVAALLRMGQRHPSLLAWTVLKGGEPGRGERWDYLEMAADLAAPKAAYEIAYRAEDASLSAGLSSSRGSGRSSSRSSSRNLNTDSTGTSGAGVPEGHTLVASEKGLEGLWGEIAAAPMAESPVWPFEIIPAALCFGFLLFLEVMNLRTRGLPYTYLMTGTRLKRWADSACWMRWFTFVGGMGTLAGFCVHILLQIPMAASPWLGYPWDFLARVQGMPPYLLWVTLTVFFMVLRILQLGLAAPGFAHTPDPLKLACWLEQKCGWRWIAALGWVFVCFGGPLWLAMVLYIGLPLVWLPMRMKVYRRIDADMRFLWILPGGVAAVLLVLGVWYGKEVLYVWRILS